MLLSWHTSKAKSGLVCPVTQRNCPTKVLIISFSSLHSNSSFWFFLLFDITIYFTDFIQFTRSIMISELDWLIFRSKYLIAAQCSDPIVKTRLIGLITSFKKSSVPPKRKSSTCVHNNPFTFDWLCHINTAGSDSHTMAPNPISSLLTLRYQDLEASLSPEIVVFNFYNVVFWQSASFGGFT